MGTRLTILAVLVILMGCSDDPARPTQGGAAPLDSVPLAMGTRWTYDLTFDATWTNPDGSDARPPRHVDGAGTREIIGLEGLTGRVYVVESFTAAPEGAPTSVEWRRFRRDGEVLYRADVSASVAPGDVPEDFIVGDLVQLRFPVTDGATWQRFPGSDAAVYVVEGSDMLQIAGVETEAWRVRLDLSNHGPDDYRRMWYGTQGLLRRVAHAEFDAFDSGTGQLVHIVTHEVDELVEFERGGRP